MDDWNYAPAKDQGMTWDQSVSSLRRESGLVSSLMHLMWWQGVRSYFSLWHRLAIVGGEHLPLKPPFVLIANHSSHLDALALGAPLSWKLRDCVFPVAAGDVFFSSTATSTLSALLLNALPMWRKHCGPHALDELRRRMVEEPCGYILFPEGARSRDGNLLPFKPGLGMLVAGTEVPVIPCHLDGCFRALPAGRIIPRPTRITLRVGQPIHFADHENNRAGWTSVATKLTAAVEQLAALRATQDESL